MHIRIEIINKEKASVVRQIENEKHGFFLKRIFKDFIGKRTEKQGPVKTNNLSEECDDPNVLLREVCDEKFLNEVKKLQAKRKRMLFWIGEFDPPKRLMTMYKKYEIQEDTAAFMGRFTKKMASKYEDSAYEAADRRPYGLIDHLKNRSEAKDFMSAANSQSQEAGKYKSKSEAYGEILRNIESEMSLYKLEIERLKKLLETVVDIEEGLKIERVVEELEDELSFVSKKELNKKVTEKQRDKKEPHPTMGELTELVLKAQTREELEQLYSSYTFSWIRYTRNLFKKEFKLKDELKYYESSLVKLEENLGRVRAKIHQIAVKQSKGPTNFREYKELQKLTEKEKDILGGIDRDRLICEIINLEQKLK